MKQLLLLSWVAGLMFGMWPLLLNRSGLEGFASSAIFISISLCMVVPVALLSGQLQQVLVSNALWYALAAGLCGAVGILSFTTLLSIASRNEVGLLFISMLMVQLMVPVIYHFVQSGDYSLRHITGIIGAFAVIYLLR